VPARRRGPQRALEAGADDVEKLASTLPRPPWGPRGSAQANPCAAPTSASAIQGIASPAKMHPAALHSHRQTFPSLVPTGLLARDAVRSPSVQASRRIGCRREPLRSAIADSSSPRICAGQRCALRVMEFKSCADNRTRPRATTPQVTQDSEGAARCRPGGCGTMARHVQAHGA
jgi:hypothetical protein